MTALDQLRPLVGMKQACQALVGSARDLVPALKTSCGSFSCRPIFREKAAAFDARAFRKRTVHRTCVPS
jgi:hypothetical protein